MLRCPILAQGIIILRFVHEWDKYRQLSDHSRPSTPEAAKPLSAISQFKPLHFLWIQCVVVRGTMCYFFFLPSKGTVYLLLNEYSVQMYKLPYTVVVMTWSIQNLVSARLDPHVLFVPETPDNLVVSMEPFGVVITCRVSNPNFHVTLRSVPSGEEMSAFYDSRMGFLGNLSPGQYQCETPVNGQIFRSAIYTVNAEGKPRQSYISFIMRFIYKMK